jgi:hypothetical protein
MSEENVKKGEEIQTNETSGLTHKLQAVGWGLFFVWVGIAVLTKIEAGIGIGLLGIGIITLGMQGVRKYFNLKLEGFWVVVGLLFAIGGIWHLFEAKIPLVAIVLIIGGILVIVSGFRSKRLKTK